MRDMIERMSDAGINLFAAGSRLMATGNLNDSQRQYIRNHRDDLMAALPVDTKEHLKALAVDLPVDHIWLMDSFFTPQDLTFISLGEYLTGDLEPYRDEIRQFIALHKVNLA